MTDEAASGVHTVHEASPWTEDVGDHPARADSPIYVKSRALMVELAKQCAPFGPAPWQDHHSGVLWLFAGSWFTVRNNAGLEWSMQFCVAPDTRILTDDLRWVRAGDLEIGDGLMGFEDERQPRQKRHWRRGTVESCDVVKRDSVQLVFADGTAVICAKDHRWLASPGNTATWATAQHMKVGGAIPSRVIKPVNVWDGGDSRDAGYLAAAFDGEGHIVQRADTRGGNGVSTRLSFGQRDNAMLAAVVDALDRQGFEYRRNPGPDVERIQIGHREELMRFLGQVRPERLLAEFNPNMLGQMQTRHKVQLAERWPVGERELVALNTSTRTYVAEGLASHNCADPAKVEALLRQTALKLYARFPESLDEFDKLGHPEQRVILATAITDAAGVAAWTDSIFNASMPLPQAIHTGTIKAGADGSKGIAGIHHYPLPVWDGQLVKFDNFTLWVTDAEGQAVAVAPVAAPGSGDARVRVIHATPGTALHDEAGALAAAGQDHIVEADHPLAVQAFAQQAAA